MYYKGWDVYQGPQHPVTGRWRAQRFGVGLCHPTKEGLLVMIDSKVKIEQLEREAKVKGPDRRNSNTFGTLDNAYSLGSR